MTAATVTPTLANVYTALGNFIVAQLGLASGQVVQGYPNRDAMPLPGFVAMYAISKKRLRTNIDNYGSTTPGSRARPRDGRTRPASRRAN